MKQYMRIVVLFIVAVVLLLVFTLFKKVSAPESSIIAGEKKKMEASFDKDRAARDEIYAVGFRDKLAFLEFQLAVAYNKENRPDDAVTVLEKLIAQEEAKSRGGVRRSASYEDEARYAEALETAFRLKHDDAGAQRAKERHDRAAAKTVEAKRKERLEEGRSVGLKGE